MSCKDPKELHVAASECVLKDCVIEPDGGSVRLNASDAEGRSVVLRLSLDQLGSLTMTLPSLLERALRLHHADTSLRYVFPLGSWTVEATAKAGTVILSLDTPDGFKASFGVPMPIAEEMALALGGRQSAPGSARSLN
jgi:hypothetical protein